MKPKRSDAATRGSSRYSLRKTHRLRAAGPPTNRGSNALRKTPPLPLCESPCLLGERALRRSPRLLGARPLRRSPRLLGKAISHTSIIGLITDSLVILGIDARLLLSGFATVISNRHQKTITLDNKKKGRDQRFVVAGFSGDTAVHTELKKELRQVANDKELLKDLSTRFVVDRTMTAIGNEVKKWPGYHGVIIIGVGETQELELFLVEALEKNSYKPEAVKIDLNGYCLAGAGAQWLKLFMEEDAKKHPDLKLTLDAYKKLVMEAMIEASKNDIATGGFLQGIAILKEDGGFKCMRSFKYQMDFDYSDMDHLDWVEKEDPKLE